MKDDVLAKQMRTWRRMEENFSSFFSVTSCIRLSLVLIVPCHSQPLRFITLIQYSNLTAPSQVQSSQLSQIPKYLGESLNPLVLILIAP